MTCGRISIGFWAVLVIVVVVLVSFAAVMPSGQRATPSAFGDWSAAVKISNDEMYFGDVSDFALYKYGWVNLTYSGDFGPTWSPETAMGGRIDIVTDVIHRVNSTDPYSGTLFYEKSIDNGTSWSAPYDLGLPAPNDGFFGINMLNGTLFVYDWDAYGMGEIVVRTSADNGDSWAPPVVVAQAAMIGPLPNDMVFTDGTVYLAFWNFTTSPTFGYDLRLIRSYDMGVTWEDEQTVDIGAMPIMKEDGGKLYITYLHYELVGMDMYWMLNFTSSTDGTTWSSPVTVAQFVDVTDPVLYHSLAVSGGRIAVAYLDYRIGFPDTYTIRINYSSDDGNSWLDLGDVTGLLSNGELPSVWIVGDTLHFFWVNMGSGDWTGGPYPTYYRSMDLSGTVIPEFGLLVAPVVGAMVIAIMFSRRRTGR